MSWWLPWKRKVQGADVGRLRASRTSPCRCASRSSSADAITASSLDGEAQRTSGDADSGESQAQEDRSGVKGGLRKLPVGRAEGAGWGFIPPLG